MEALRSSRSTLALSLQAFTAETDSQTSRELIDDVRLVMFVDPVAQTTNMKLKYGSLTENANKHDVSLSTVKRIWK